jgi:hypothetical protein
VPGQSGDFVKKKGINDKGTYMKILMKLSIAALVIGMQTTALSSNNYEDLVAEGYRWAKIDGPYACPTKEDLREITSNPSDINKVHMIEQIRAYFLIQGALVKVIEEDRSAGMAQIRMAGINIDLWTFSKFLSKRSIKDAYAEIETPETSGLTPADTSVQSGVLEGVSGTAGSPQQAGRKGFEDREQLWQQPAPGGYNLGIR